MSPPPLPTHASRLAQLGRLLRTRHCTHVLVSDPVDVRYLCGFRSSNVLLLAGAGRALLCTDFRYETAAREFCRGKALEPVIMRESDYAFLRPLLPGRCVLGVQAGALTLEQYERLRRALPQTRIVKLGAELAALTVGKSAAEAACISRAARIADRALAVVVRRLRTGLSERQVRDMLEQECRRRGSEGPAFDTIVLFGERSALPHGVPGEARLQRGDLVLFDFGCTVEGLRSDITRTVVKGKASEQQRRIYRTVLRAQSRARAALRPGVPARRIDALARAVIEAAGHGEHFGHATGHGVGYRIHEAPRLSRTSREVLQTGAVVTVEPGIYIPKTGGVRIEDMLWLRPGGAQLLSRFPRRLMEV